MRDQANLVKTLERAGFDPAPSPGAHMKWRCPCGHAQLTVARSVGKGRAVQNTVALIARTLRTCHQNMKGKK